MRNRFRNITALWVIAIIVALASVLNAAPPARSVRIAVLTPGLAFGEILTGFRDGLDQLVRNVFVDRHTRLQAAREIDIAQHGNPFALGDAPTSPVLTVGAGYGGRTFVVDRSGLMTSGSLDLPDVDYQLFDPGVALRLPRPPPA